MNDKAPGRAPQSPLSHDQAASAEMPAGPDRNGTDDLSPCTCAADVALAVLAEFRKLADRLEAVERRTALDTRR